MKEDRDQASRSRVTKKTMTLPWELIIEILLRLPVKTLVRFKCVCKSWLLLLSDPHFATSHFELASSRTHRHRLMLIAPSSVPQILSIDFNESLHSDSDSTSLDLNFLPPSSYHNLQIIGSCRGFLLLNSCQTLWVWNPSTGVHKKVFSSPVESNMNAMFFTLFYGFGYDPSKDDYLVVKASYNPFSGCNATWVQFFSLRDNTWRDIEAPHLSYNLLSSECFSKGLFLNGAIHWLGFPDGVSMNDVVAFDVTERSFSEIPLRVDFEGDIGYCHLGVFGEWLSVYCGVGWGHSVEIWVMKEYKVESSWTKTIVVSCEDIPTGYFFPISSTKDGDIVGTDGNCGLAKCNGKGELLEYRSYWNNPCGSQRVAYAESLLSLP